MVSMKRLSRDKRMQIVRCFTEGVGVNATARMAGASKNSVLKLLADLGPVCRAYQDGALRNLSCHRLQCDEIWSFCGMKEKNVPADLKGVWGFGDVWTWTALCADTKLVPSWMVAGRDSGAALAFVEDLAGRLANRVQLTTDGHKAYLEAVEGAFGVNIDFAQLVKLYGAPEGASMTERKYSPGECGGRRTDTICGKPDPRHVSTSYAERLNLELRTKNRRMTRLTNGFSRKVENLEHSLDVGFMVYNFARVHGRLRVTPAMEAGVSDHVWEMEEIVALLEVKEPDAVAVGAKRRDRRKSD